MDDKNELQNLLNTDVSAIVETGKKRGKRNHTIAIITIVSVLAVVALSVLSVKYLIPSIKYSSAEKLIEKGRYDEAISAFAKLGDYKDSSVKASEIYYKKGLALLEEGKFDAARDAFRNSDVYGDSADRILETYYMQGEMSIRDGNYSLAASLFINAEDYLDAQIKVKESYYKMAEKQLNDGMYVNAKDSFIKAEDYSDAEQQIISINDKLYTLGVEAIANQEYVSAMTFLENILDYSDSRSYYNYAVIKNNNYDNGKFHSLEGLHSTVAAIAIPDLKAELLELPQYSALYKLKGKWGTRYENYYFNDGAVERSGQKHFSYVLNGDSNYTYHYPVYYCSGHYYVGQSSVYEITDITPESITIGGEIYKKTQ